MSALDDGANRSPGVVDCEDEFRRTIAKSNRTPNATRLQTQTSPLDEDGSDDDGCSEACSLSIPRGGKHTLDEIARTSVLQSPCDRLPFGPLFRVICSVFVCSPTSSRSIGSFSTGERAPACAVRSSIDHCRPRKAQDWLAMRKKGTIARRRDSHFAIERRLSTKPHFDLVRTPIIHERHEERTS
jgi:hypothetical protein